MPAICRFYLKGYCRYGQNCRFEHPGENSGSYNDESQRGGGGGGGFSFSKALDEVSNTNSPQGFSFTQALQQADNSSPYRQTYNHNTSYFDQGPQYQAQNSYNSYFNNYSNRNNSSNYGYDASPFKQHYNQQPQQQQSFNPGGFSFTQALETSSGFQGGFQSGYQSGFQGGFQGGFNSPSNSLPFGRPFQSNQISSTDIEIDDFRGATQATATENEVELTEIELKAYQSEKFTFRLIPIRPPPQHLCR